MSNRQAAKTAKKGTTDTKQSPLDAGFAGVGGVTGRAGSPAFPVPKPSDFGFAFLATLAFLAPWR